MTYKEIKKYLYGGCIVRNNKYEYKISRFNYLYTRNIGCLAWNIIGNIEYLNIPFITNDEVIFHYCLSFLFPVR